LDRCIRWRECRRSIGDHSVEELSNWNLQGDTWDIGKTNFTGGAQASYNYQADSFVWGIEAELGYLGLMVLTHMRKSTVGCSQRSAVAPALQLTGFSPI
jgi:hypothetical protein